MKVTDVVQEQQEAIGRICLEVALSDKLFIESLKTKENIEKSLQECAEALSIAGMLTPAKIEEFAKLGLVIRV